MASGFIVKLLDDMATKTIGTVMNGKQSPADNVITIRAFIDLCVMVQNKYSIDDAEIPPELCAKLYAIDYLLDCNIEKLAK